MKVTCESQTSQKINKKYLTFTITGVTFCPFVVTQKCNNFTGPCIYRFTKFKNVIHGHKVPENGNSHKLVIGTLFSRLGPLSQALA